MVVSLRRWRERRAVLHDLTSSPKRGAFCFRGSFWSAGKTRAWPDLPLHETFLWGPNGRFRGVVHQTAVGDRQDSELAKLQRRRKQRTVDHQCVELPVLATDVHASAFEIVDQLVIKPPTQERTIKRAVSNNNDHGLVPALQKSLDNRASVSLPQRV
jgi:hypothetical protein